MGVCSPFLMNYLDLDFFLGSSIGCPHQLANAHLSALQLLGRGYSSLTFALTTFGWTLAELSIVAS